MTLRIPVAAFSLLCRSLALAAAVLLLSGGVLQADELTTREGLVLEGTIQRLADGWYEITTEKGTIKLAPDAVASARIGVSPRADFLKAHADVDAKDVRAQYRMALEASELGLPELARAAYVRVIALDPDHRAARRALGYERHADEWVTAEDARRKKGLVLYRGKWMLPAEVEAASGASQLRALEVPGDVDRVRKMIRTVATAEAPLARAARLALARTDETLLLEAALSMLFEGDPQVRIAAIRILGSLGDESALRPLIFCGARDKDSAVRREAVLAAASFGHDDTAIPFTRALSSENQRLAANAAEALALLGDQRAAGYIVKRLRSHGSSTRNVVSFLNQVSYVRDYDVEIAQASNIANPDVARISEGVVLDVKVLDASYTKTWIEPLLVKSFNELVGADLHSKREVDSWWSENGSTLPQFPKKPGGRAPRRSKGRVIGVPLGE
jgi:hypothetical protein